MNIWFTGSELCWVVFLAGVGCVFALGPAPPAFADAGVGAGAISGGFFAEHSLSAGVPEPGALPAGVLPEGMAPRASSGVCEKAVAAASVAHQLPPGLLGAIATVESGRLNPQTGSTKPWPWTIDANGTGSMYDSAQSAIQAALGFEAAGITSLDIGCLQVNLAQHPDAFQNLAQAFDPAANAEYAAAFLTSLEQKFGNWPQAVAAYHSQTPALGQPYAAKVYAAWQIAPDAGPMALAAVAGPGGMAPISAVAPTTMDLTALAPPMAIMMRPGKAVNNRGLAAYRAAPVAIAADLAPPG